MVTEMWTPIDSKVSVIGQDIGGGGGDRGKLRSHTCSYKCAQFAIS